jgi:hypothetical protein
VNIVRESLARLAENKAFRLGAVSGVLVLSLALSITALAVVTHSKPGNTRTLVALAQSTATPTPSAQSTETSSPTPTPKSSPSASAGQVKGDSVVASNVGSNKTSQPVKTSTVTPTPAPPPAPTLVSSTTCWVVTHYPNNVAYSTYQINYYSDGSSQVTSGNSVYVGGSAPAMPQCPNNQPPANQPASN